MEKMSKKLKNRRKMYVKCQSRPLRAVFPIAKLFTVRTKTYKVQMRLDPGKQTGLIRLEKSSNIWVGGSRDISANFKNISQNENPLIRLCIHPLSL